VSASYTEGAEGTVVVSGVTVESNSAEQGGGVYLAAGLPVTLEGSALEYNVADYGGGLGIDGEEGASITVRNTEIRGNIASWGGAVGVYPATVALTDCVVEENAAAFGAVYLDDATWLEVTGTDFGVYPYDNIESDIFIETLAGTASYSDYGADSTFSCDAATLSCVEE
jgi:hypothetical protein